MSSFARLPVIFAATILTGVVAQYNDGYETVDSPTDPVQIRLAYQGPTAMMVSWNTFSQLDNPTVAYGISPDALTQSASSSVSVTYPTSLTYNNHVNVTGLLPFTTYYYLPQYSNATTPYNFTTSRLAGDTTPFTVGVVADMGTFGSLGLSDTVGDGAANPLRPNEQTTIAALTEVIDSYEFLVHAGDIAYADYWLKEEVQGYLPNTTTVQGAQVYEHILNAFYDELVGVTSQKAYMVNAGNHDANCDNGGTSGFDESICLTGQTNFTGFINHWRMPSGPSDGLGNFWYSYDYGMVHFIHIDTETDLGNGLVGPDEGSPEFGGPFGATNQQIDWLAADLASVNRTITPWIVAFGHRGWYLSATGSVCQNCQTTFEDLFYEYDVDLYFNGHAHLYERTVPVFNGAIDTNGLNNPNATLYITNGAAGHYDGLDTFTAIQPYSAYHEASDYSWSTLSFTNSTHMTISTLWSANNTVLDEAVLYKAHVYTNTTRPIPTATTTSTSPTSTAKFNGEGHLYVYTGGHIEGDVGSADTWYNTPGQNTATFTAVPVAGNGSTFTLQHSSDFCAIGSDSSFDCSGSDVSEASIFGQTSDGNLTYNGSPAFYASSAASSGAKPSIYVTSLPVSLNIVWGTTELIVTAPATTSTVTTTATSPPFLSTGPTASSGTLKPTTSYLWSNSTTPVTLTGSPSGVSKSLTQSKPETSTVSTVYLTTTYVVTSYEVSTVSHCPASTSHGHKTASRGSKP